MLLPIGPCVPTQDAVIIKFPARAVNAGGCACSDARKSAKAISFACRCLITPVAGRESENGEGKDQRPATRDLRGQAAYFCNSTPAYPQGITTLPAWKSAMSGLPENFQAFISVGCSASVKS